MEIAKTDQCQEFQRHEEFLEDYCKCSLCGTDLSFYHQIDYVTLNVTENATCPSCMIQTRTRDYTLQ